MAGRGLALALLLTGVCLGCGDRGPRPAAPGPGHLVVCAGTGEAGRERAQELLASARTAGAVTGASLQNDGERYAVLLEFFPADRETQLRQALAARPDPLPVSAGDVRSC